MKIYIALFHRLLLRIAPEHSSAEKKIMWALMSQSGPWMGTSAVPKGAHSRVRTEEPIIKMVRKDGAWSNADTWRQEGCPQASTFLLFKYVLGKLSMGDT